MAGHAQLQFVMTECSKTQIRLTGLNYSTHLQPAWQVARGVILAFHNIVTLIYSIKH